MISPNTLLARQARKIVCGKRTFMYDYRIQFLGGVLARVCEGNT